MSAGIVNHMEKLHALVDEHRVPLGLSYSDIAKEMQMSRQALSDWWNVGLQTVPGPFQLYRLSVAIRTPYRTVLDTALADFNYLPESRAAESQPGARLKNAKGKKLT